jgi:FemAB-related protein (PEP-CTERM system-associated)
MNIIEIKESNEQFEGFLNTNEHSVFHTFSYKKFIEEAFDCKYSILAIDDGGIKTVLPVVRIKSRLFGNKIISSAYLEYGGFAGDENYVGGMVDFIDKKYSGDDYLEIRGGIEKFDSVLSSRLIKKNLYKRFILRLGDVEGVWRGIQKWKRKAVKKALRNVEVKEVPFSDLNEFYGLYCKNMKQFGSPPYAKKYFVSFYRNIVSEKQGKIYGAYYQGKLTAALLGFCYQDRVHIVIAVSDIKYRWCRPNDAVHWEFIKWACKNGFKYFDFGRVREGSGQFEYKRKWGPELLELPSYFLLWKMKEVPMVDPSKYGLATKLWRKMPLWATKLVGMKLRKGLGI